MMKKRCLSCSFLFVSPSLPPVTSLSLTSLLTKVFIGLHSINYHPISYSHSGTAAIQHSVKPVHLASPDTVMFPAFLKLAVIERGKFSQRIPRRLMRPLKLYSSPHLYISRGFMRRLDDLSLNSYFS